MVNPNVHLNPSVSKGTRLQQHLKSLIFQAADIFRTGLVTAYPIIAGLVTVFRLVVRSPKRWWWDDLCAFIGLIALVLQTVVLWLRISRYPRTSLLPLVSKTISQYSFTQL